MRKAIYLIPVLIITIASCSKNKKQMLTQKWQAISIYNPQMDSFIAEQEKFIDTFGMSTDDETNKMLYGFSNVDSMRNAMKAELADFKAMQDHSMKSTWFEFRKDGIALMNFSGHVDSSKWYLEEDKELVLDEIGLKGTGEKIRMVVEELNDTLLKLQFNEGGMSSTISFHAVKN